MDDYCPLVTRLVGARAGVGNGARHSRSSAPLQQRYARRHDDRVVEVRVAKDTASPPLSFASVRAMNPVKSPIKGQGH